MKRLKRLNTVLLTALFMSIIFISSNVVYGLEEISKESLIKMSLEKPLNNEVLENEMEIKGSIESLNSLECVEVYLNEDKLGIAALTNVNSTKKEDRNLFTGDFSYKLNPQEFFSGDYKLKVLIKDSKGNKSEEIRSIKIKSAKTPIIRSSEQSLAKTYLSPQQEVIIKGETLIMGEAEITKGQAVTFFKRGNPNKSDEEITYFIDSVWQEAKDEGIRPDVAFALMMKETGYLKFGGDVNADQNNFGGIGAVGNGASGNKFPDMQTGIRVVIQHLKAYSCTEPLNKPVVDPRFTYVKRGSSPWVETLAGKWAVGNPNYGTEIVQMVQLAKTLESSPLTYSKAKVSSFNVYDGDVKLATGNLKYGKTYKLNAIATSGSKPLYQFWMKDKKTGKWTMLKDYSEENTYSFTAPANGKDYLLGVHVKDQYSRDRLDNYIYNNITLSEGSAKVDNIKLYTGSEEVLDGQLKHGKAYTVKAFANADSKPLYQFWLKNKSTGVWTMLRDYSDNNSYNFVAPGDTENYLLGVHVKDQYSKARLDNFRYDNIKVTIGSAKVEDIKIYDGSNEIKDGQLKFGKNYTVNAFASADSKPLYQFWLKDIKSGKWTMLRDYSENNSYNWRASVGDGNYLIGVHVKDKYSLKRLDNFRYDNITVFKEVPVEGKAKLDDMIMYVGGNPVKEKTFGTGKNYTVRGFASATTKPLYQFWLKDKSTGIWTMLRDYSEDNTYNWTVSSRPGNYLLGVHVKDKNSKERLDDFRYDNISVYLSAPIKPARKLIVLDAGHGGKDSGAVGNGLREADLNQNLTLKLGNKLKAMGYDVVYTRDYIPGNYNSVGEDLEARAHVANTRNADLFISIHHDSGPSGANGTSTHYSTYRPRVDNSGLETIGDIIYDRTPCDAAIKSRELSKMIANRLGQVGFTNRGDSDHNLYVTRMTTMPSVLVECGFITSSKDMGKCTNPIIQNQMVDAIASSIKDLF